MQSLETLITLNWQPYFITMGSLSLSSLSSQMKQPWCPEAEALMSCPRNSQSIQYLFRVWRHFYVWWIEHFDWISKEEVNPNQNSWVNWLSNDWIPVSQTTERHADALHLPNHSWDEGRGILLFCFCLFYKQYKCVCVWTLQNIRLYCDIFHTYIKCNWIIFTSHDPLFALCPFPDSLSWKENSHWKVSSRGNQSLFGANEVDINDSIKLTEAFSPFSISKYTFIGQSPLF